MKGLSGKFKNYENQLNKLTSWTIKSFIELTGNDLKEYLTFYKNLNDYGETTLNNTRHILSSFYGQLEIGNKIIMNPMERIPSIKTPKLLRQEINNHPNPIRNSAIFEFLLSSGLRLSELTSLKKDDIILSDCKGVIMGKGGKEQIFYFSEKTKIFLKEYMISWIDDNEWLFIQGNAPYNKLGNNGIGGMILELGRIINIKDVHPHTFHRILVTCLVHKGLPLEQVSKILGHSSLIVTKRYSEADKELIFF